MSKTRFTDEAYSRVAGEAKSKGSSTFAGEQRHRAGHGLHELVDPKGFGVIRRSIGFRQEIDGHFVLLNGTAMLEETRLDTTGSMGNNVEIAMRVLPKTYNLLAKVKDAVLGRYDTQMITAIFGDVRDSYVLCRSQAEMNEKIAEQMTYMVPEHGGDDYPEDPHYGIFGGAYLTAADINKYGLKYYDFTVTDAPGRDRLNIDTLIRVFGESVFEKVRENGYQIDEKNLPTTKEVVKDLLKNAHAFVLLVGEETSAMRFWVNTYGSDRVVMLPRTELLPEVKAAIMGLTEGVLTLSTLNNFLVNEAGLDTATVESIKRAVAGIPIGAQAMLPNFNKIPLKGAIFANKTDLWPSENTEDNKKPKKEEEIWL